MNRILDVHNMTLNVVAEGIIVGNETVILLEEFCQVHRMDVGKEVVVPNGMEVLALVLDLNPQPLGCEVEEATKYWKKVDWGQKVSVKFALLRGPWLSGNPWVWVLQVQVNGVIPSRDCAFQDLVLEVGLWHLGVLPLLGEVLHVIQLEMSMEAN